MLSQIENYTNKSFDNYTGPKETFQKTNIIFGYNGQGKSSLAKGIYDMSLIEGQTYETCRLYNNEYVRMNVALEDDPNKINGIKAIFGEKNIEELENLEAEKTSHREIGDYENEIATLTDFIRVHMDEIVENKKGNLKIQKKARKFNLTQLLDLYKQDIEVAKSIQPDEDLIKGFNGDDDLEAKYQKFVKLDLPDFRINLDRDSLEKIENIFSNEYRKINIPSSEIIKWIKEGLKHHGEGDDCQFCNNPINYDEIEDNILKYEMNIKQQDSLSLKDFSQRLSYAEEKYYEFQESIPLIKKFIVNFNNEYNKELSESFLPFEQLKDEIHVKVENMSRTILYFQEQDLKEKQNKEQIKDLLLLIEKVESVHQCISREFDNAKKQFQKEIVSQQDLVKGAIGIEIIQSKTIINHLKELETKIKELRIINEKNSAIDNKIFAIKSSQSEYNDYRKLLNSIFEKLEMDFKLEFDDSNKNYYLEHRTSKEELSINSISEGEMNLLGLIFFYYQLISFSLKEEELSHEFNESIETIIIDDPVSSLDDNNKFYVLELMDEIIGASSSQVFILTHVWEDFVQLARGLKENDSKLYEVYKDEKSRSLIKTVNKPVRAYRKLFYEVYQFSQISRTDLDSFNSVHHMPNAMRRIFEEFLTFKNGSPLIPQKREQDKISNLYAISTNEAISRSKISQLGVILKIINIFSHQIVENPNEIHKSARYLMNFMKDMDPAHYSMMTNPW